MVHLGKSNFGIFGIFRNYCKSWKINLFESPCIMTSICMDHQAGIPIQIRIGIRFNHKLIIKWWINDWDRLPGPTADDLDRRLGPTADSWESYRIQQNLVESLLWYICLNQAFRNNREHNLKHHNTKNLSVMNFHPCCRISATSLLVAYHSRHTLLGHHVKAKQGKARLGKIPKQGSS